MCVTSLMLLLSKPWRRQAEPITQDRPTIECTTGTVLVTPHTLLSPSRQVTTQPENMQSKHTNRLCDGTNLALDDGDLV